MKMEVADSIERLVLIIRLYDVTFLKIVPAVSKIYSTPVCGWIHAEDTRSAFRGFSAESRLNDYNIALAFHTADTSEMSTGFWTPERNSANKLGRTVGKPDIIFSTNFLNCNGYLPSY
jgi:hypothetical protein